MFPGIPFTSSLSATLNRYNGYNILLLDRYVSFDMPEGRYLDDEGMEKIVKIRRGKPSIRKRS